MRGGFSVLSLESTCRVALIIFFIVAKVVFGCDPASFPVEPRAQLRPPPDQPWEATRARYHNVLVLDLLSWCMLFWRFIGAQRHV